MLRKLESLLSALPLDRKIKIAERAVKLTALLKLRHLHKNILKNSKN
jgi:hypothetical protein